MVRSTSLPGDGGTPMTTCIRKSLHWMAGYLSSHIGKWLWARCCCNHDHDSPVLRCIGFLLMKACWWLMPMTVITGIKSYFQPLDGSFTLMSSWQHDSEKNQCSPWCGCKSVIVVSNSGKKKVIKCGHVVCGLINDTSTCWCLCPQQQHSSTPSFSTSHSSV